MIDKWLKAGVLEEWFEREVVPRMRGQSSLIRYADDLVMAFEDFEDCRRVFEVLGKRLAKYGLTLHPEKTRMVDFRFKHPGGQRPPATKATSFDFLGFTHVWGKLRRGKNVVQQCTAKSRYARAVKAYARLARLRLRYRPTPGSHETGRNEHLQDQDVARNERGG